MISSMGPKEKSPLIDSRIWAERHQGQALCMQIGSKNLNKSRRLNEQKAAPKQAPRNTHKYSSDSLEESKS